MYLERVERTKAIRIRRQIYARSQSFHSLQKQKTSNMFWRADKIARANWTEIKRMLNCLSGAERLSYYNNAHAIESGRIKWILLRLKELVEQ